MSALVPGQPKVTQAEHDQEQQQEEEEGGVDSMLQALGLQADTSASLTVRKVSVSKHLPGVCQYSMASIPQVQNMALILQHLLHQGGGLHEAENVMVHLEPGIRTTSEQVPANTKKIIYLFGRKNISLLFL